MFQCQRPSGAPRGRKPRFTPSDVLVMAILRDNGWTYDDIAAEWKAARSIITKYLQEFRPGRWAA